MDQAHLETLVYPQGGVIGGQDNDQNEDQAQDERPDVFTRENLAKDFHGYPQTRQSPASWITL
jgi:hypothetical protein